MICPKCDDTGLIELIGGTHRTIGAQSRAAGIGPLEVEATPERPIYKRCTCRDDPTPINLDTERETRRFGG